MNPCILSLETQVPEHCLTQSDAAERISSLFSNEKAIKKLFANTCIEKRYHACSQSFLDSLLSSQVPGMSERNQVFQQEAPKLSLKVSEKALKKWGGSKDEITHIISVTCTGTITPGIEFILAKKLKLPNEVSRFGINHMGCFGAFKGLEMARAFCQSNPKNRVLLVCTELCSLHYQENQRFDAFISNAIFADGAAACVVGCSPKNKLFEIVDCASFSIDNSQSLMQWNASNTGMEMKLSRKVPDYIEDNLPRVFQLLKKKWEISQVEWAIHPGGKAILEAVQRSLMIGKKETIVSWEILKNYGNMSSPTFLFILKEMLQLPKKKAPCVGLGFGPGLTVEALLLQR